MTTTTTTTRTNELSKRESHRANRASKRMLDGLERSRARATRTSRELAHTVGQKTTAAAASARNAALRATSSAKRRVADLTAGQKVAVAASLGVAATAAAALTWRTLSSRKHQNPSSDSTTIRVEAGDHDSWRLEIEGHGEQTFETKDDALAAARELARDSAPSELLVKRLDGSEQLRHKYDT